MKKILTLLACIAAVFALVSCTAEINLTQKADGSVAVKFNGAAGVAFKKLILSASGMEDGDIIFDTKEIAYEMAKNGFSNVKTDSKTGTDLSISADDSKGTSVLFTSGLLKAKKDALEVSLSPDKLLNFYNTADEQTVQFLDLLLAPIFNDEIMEENEYVEMMSSFYGSAAAKEIEECTLKITITTANGSSQTQLIPLTKILTLNEEIDF